MGLAIYNRGATATGDVEDGHSHGSIIWKNYLSYSLVRDYFLTMLTWHGHDDDDDNADNAAVHTCARSLFTALPVLLGFSRFPRARFTAATWDVFWKLPGCRPGFEGIFRWIVYDVNFCVHAIQIPKFQQGLAGSFPHTLGKFP